MAKQKVYKVLKTIHLYDEYKYMPNQEVSEGTLKEYFNQIIIERMIRDEFIEPIPETKEEEITLGDGKDIFRKMEKFGNEVTDQSRRYIFIADPKDATIQILKTIDGSECYECFIDNKSEQFFYDFKSQIMNKPIIIEFTKIPSGDFYHKILIIKL